MARQTKQVIERIIQQAKPPKSSPTGLYVLCPGTGITHREQVYLQLKMGQRALFIRCPFPTCMANCFFNGTEWKGKGWTADQVRAKNPHAVVV